MVAGITYLAVALFTIIYSFFGLKLDVLTSLRNGVCILIIPISTIRSESKNRRRKYFITITDIDKRYSQIIVSVTGTKEEVERGECTSREWINDTFRRMAIIQDDSVLNLHWEIYDVEKIPKYRTRRYRWKKKQLNQR